MINWCKYDAGRDSILKKYFDFQTLVCIIKLIINVYLVIRTSLYNEELYPLYISISVLISETDNFGCKLKDTPLTVSAVRHVKN